MITTTGYDPSSALLSLFVVLIFAVLVIGVFLVFIVPRKTQRYRKELVDLYVAGRIKQIATKDKINLEVEYNDFKKWVRYKQRIYKDLDYAIEGELMDRLDEESKTESRGAKA